MMPIVYWVLEKPSMPECIISWKKQPKQENMYRKPPLWVVFFLVMWDSTGIVLAGTGLFTSLVIRAMINYRSI